MLRRSHSIWPLITLLAAFVGPSACNVTDVPSGDSSSGTASPARPAQPATAAAAAGSKPSREPTSTTTVTGAPLGAANVAPAAVPGTAAPVSVAEPPLACATLRDVSDSDLVRVEGTTLFYADATSGLSIVDVSDPMRPSTLASVPFVGTPMALFVRDDVAWVVFVDWDARFGAGASATVIRAIDVADPAHPRLLGDDVRAGIAREARLVGGHLYVLRAANHGSMVESFGVRKGSSSQPAVAGKGTLTALDAVQLPGTPAQLAASAAGLAAITLASDTVTDVTWLDLPLERPGAIGLRATVKVSGGVPTWERGESKIASADEGQRVRLVTCATRSCAPTEGATLRVVEFGTALPPRVAASLPVTTQGGLPVTRFSNELLYVGETSRTARDATVLHVVRTDEAKPRVVAHLPLRGLVSSLVPRDGSLVALGSTNAGAPGAESQTRIILHDIDAQKPAAPRLRASATFGSDWTWSVALDDEDAVSFDPASHLVAVPFTAWRHADGRSVQGTQLVDLTRFGAERTATIASDGLVERAIFLDGHLVTIGPDGVRGVDYASARRPDLAERPIEIVR